MSPQHGARMPPSRHSPIHRKPVEACALSLPTKHPAASSPNIAPPPHVPNRPATVQTTLRIDPIPISPAQPLRSAPRSPPDCAPPQPIGHTGVRGEPALSLSTGIESNHTPTSPPSRAHHRSDSPSPGASMLTPLTPRRCPRTWRLQRRPAVPSRPQPSSPTRQKIRPKLSLASPPPPGAGWREIAPPSPPPNPRRRPPARSPVRSPQPLLAAPRRTTQPPAQASPHRPGKTPPTRAPLPSRATPRSVRRRAWPGASRIQPKDAPPRLKSFLEKTLTAREAPDFRRSGLQRHSPAPASTPPPRPSTLAWTDQASEPV